MPLERHAGSTPHAQVADVAAALADWTRGSGPMLAPVGAASARLKAEGRAHTQRGSGTYAGPPGPLTRGGRFSPGHLVSIVDNRDGPRQTVEFTIAALPGSREIAPAGERLAKRLQKLSHETPGYL